MPDLKNRSALDCPKVLDTLQKTGFWFDLGSLEKGSAGKCSSDMLCRFFNQILSEILKDDTGIIDCVRTSPAMVCDGRSVDLFKLFWFVRKKGGYDLVSKNKMWAFVLEECGLDASILAFVKLIYSKYLYKLDLRLGSVFKEEIFYGIGGESDDNMIQLKFNEIGKNMITGTKLQGWTVENDCIVNKIREEIPNGDDDEKNGNVNDELILRRKESFSGMLNWVTGVAKQATDEKDGKFRTQILLAREARLLKRKASPYLLHSHFQKKQKMHPSMYEATEVSREGLRCSNRKHSILLSSAISPCSQPNPPSKTPISPTDNALWVTPKNPKKSKKIYVGGQFQAEIPSWEGPILESDPKWLGTRIWPLETPRSQDRIGKGKENLCFCKVPGSVNCVRFHVAEKRMRLRSEIGAKVFYAWRFDRMGEEVSLSWTPEEEEDFKNVVSRNPPSLNFSFWEEIFKRFPTKTRENLVGYYFNVFVIRRRSYQNRMCPENVDSDDDESAFECLNGGFRVEGVEVCGSIGDVCAQNGQCFEFD